VVGTRIFFAVIALALVCAGLWAFRHDQNLRNNSSQVNLGDPNDVVRELLGEPTREGPCGSLTAVPSGCSQEYVYRYWLTLFNPEYQVVWFDRSGKMLGEQRIISP
jgi:hypothetical protein